MSVVPRSARASVLLAVAWALSCAPRSQIGQLEPALEAHPVLAVAVHEEPAAPPSSGPRQVGECALPERDLQRFTVAHVNDMQARWSERILGRSRYAYVAGYLRALVREVPETIVLDAGDDYEKGAIAELRSMGEATRQMVQALPIDVRTIGNHDFAYGLDAVLEDVRASAHPVLAANVAYADGTSPFASFVRIDVGCLKVGVTGLVTQSYGADDRPIDDAYFDLLAQSQRYAEALERVVRAHRGEVDVMIALDHLGLFEDATLAARVPGVHLFVGGHSEDSTARPIYIRRRDGSHAFVVQAGHYARAVGRLDLAWNRRDKRLVVERAQLVPVDARMPYAEDVAKLAREVEQRYAPDAAQPIAWARREVRRGGPMADLVARAAREVWGVDAALVGADLFWDGMPEGPITLQRMYDAVLVQREPSGTSGFSSLWVLDVSGAELAQLKARGIGVFSGPSPIVRTQTYRLAIEKRALAGPVAFRGPSRLPEARFAGEMIDVLEAYGRARTRRGLPIDD
jgi:2',3'-cyclic-nucleotide 2'-phosphodiesterase (5'-nucleotidase family)